METKEQKLEKVDIIEDKVDIVEKKQQNAEINALTLIDKAIEKDIDVDKFAKLVDIVKMLENEKAKRDFYEALSNFQGEVPPIKKLSKVDMGYGKPKYNYAEFGEIVTTIQEPLKRHGLSYHFEIGNEPVVVKGEKGEDIIVEYISVTCTVAHKGGYEKTTTMSVQKDVGAGKSNVQATGSTITYLKRYTLLALLGIGTADPDDDAQATINVDKKQKINDKDKIIKQIKSELKNCKDEAGVKRIWSKYQKYSSDKEILQVFTDWRKNQTNEKINKTNNNIKLEKGVEDGKLQL